MINNFVKTKVSTYLNLLGIIGFKMFANLTKQLDAMHAVALAALRLCAPYWVGLSTNNEQDPIKMASFYKESGHN
jgi:hypothetical protein